MDKTKLGLSQNFEAVLAYSFPPISVISGFIMLVLETENKYVRFHAMQSFILFGFYWIASIIAGLIPFLGKPLIGIISIAVFVSWLVLIISAIKGKYCKFPFIGEAIYNKIV